MALGPFWNQWRSIQQACYNKNSPLYRSNHYCYWGERGYRKFEDWAMKNLGPRPTSTSKLVRKDQTSGWEPGNLIWMEPKQHSNKMLNNCVFVTYNRQTLTLTQWSQKLGISYHTIVRRYSKGWPPKFILSKARYGYNRMPDL